MAQNEVVRSIISYPLRNENKHVIIFRYISIIDSRDKKEHFTIAFIIEFWRFLKREYIFGDTRYLDDAFLNVDILHQDKIFLIDFSLEASYMKE